MIEVTLQKYLQSCEELKPYLAVFADEMAIFNQEAPTDTHSMWRDKPQYGRIVYAVDIRGDTERTMGGVLVVDVLCTKNGAAPEEIEPIVRRLIHSQFFTENDFTVSAQWKASNYFTATTYQVVGVTIQFDLMVFPIITVQNPNVVQRFNQWTAESFEDVIVINHSKLPEHWRPSESQAAVYWRVIQDKPCSWIRATYQTEWRTAMVRAHIFAVNLESAACLASRLARQLYSCRRLWKEGESQIMTNTNNSIDTGADELKTGQLTVEATYGMIVQFQNDNPLNHIYRR